MFQFQARSARALLLLFSLVLGFQLHAFSVSQSSGGLACLRIDGHLSLDGFGTQFAEGRLHIDVVFRTRFEEEHVAVLLAEFARFNRRHFPRVL